MSIRTLHKIFMKGKDFVGIADTLHLIVVGCLSGFRNVVNVFRYSLVLVE